MKQIGIVFILDFTWGTFCWVIFNASMDFVVASFPNRNYRTSFRHQWRPSDKDLDDLPIAISIHDTQSFVTAFVFLEQVRHKFCYFHSQFLVGRIFRTHHSYQQVRLLSSNGPPRPVHEFSWCFPSFGRLTVAPNEIWRFWINDSRRVSDLNCCWEYAGCVNLTKEIDVDVVTGWIDDCGMDICDWLKGLG